MLNRLRRELEASDNGISSGVWVDLFDERAQPFITTALLVPSFLTLHEFAGQAWPGYVLLAVCGVLAYARLVPAAWIGLLARFMISAAFCVLAGAVFGAAGWSVSMAFLACGHAGVIWPPKVAVGLTVLTVALAVTTNQLAADNPWPWYGVLGVGLSVFPGLATQSRRRTLRLTRQLVEQTRRTAESDARASALAERTRIARDIHDVLAHTLSGVSLQLDLADAQLEAGKQEQGRVTMQTARGLVVNGLDEARRAVRTLRDGALDVAAALERMVLPSEQLQITADLAGLPSAVAQESVRIVQEALTNARRHAAGADTLVRVTRNDDELVVVVVNGPGQPAGSGSGSGMGLVGIRERVDLLGGTCQIGPVGEGPYSGGWQVSAQLPVREESHGR